MTNSIKSKTLKIKLVKNEWKLNKKIRDEFMEACKKNVINVI